MAKIGQAVLTPGIINAPLRTAQGAAQNVPAQKPNLHAKAAAVSLMPPMAGGLMTLKWMCRMQAVYEDDLLHRHPGDTSSLLPMEKPFPVATTWVQQEASGAAAAPPQVLRSEQTSLWTPACLLTNLGQSGSATDK